MGKSRVLIRNFQEKDTPDVITLWETVFKNDRSLDKEMIQ